MSRARVVNRLGDDFLARSGFAQQQHGRGRGRHSCRLLEGLLNGQGFGDDTVLLRRTVRAPRLRILAGAPMTLFTKVEPARCPVHAVDGIVHSELAISCKHRRALPHESWLIFGSHRAT